MAQKLVVMEKSNGAEVKGVNLKKSVNGSSRND